eukprot:364156-Chlamydomonas_euryale.AAC.4
MWCPSLCAAPRNSLCSLAKCGCAVSSKDGPGASTAHPSMRPFRFARNMSWVKIFYGCNAHRQSHAKGTVQCGRAIETRVLKWLCLQDDGLPEDGQFTM